jgi:hypothetical protein
VVESGEKCISKIDETDEEEMENFDHFQVDLHSYDRLIDATPSPKTRLDAMPPNSLTPSKTC